MKNILIVLSSFFLFSCNLNVGYKNPVQISKSKMESVNRKVFIKDYTISNIESFDSSYHFPIKQVWAEKSWHLELDKNGKEIPVVNSSSLPKVVFSLVPDSFFIEDNFLEKWTVGVANV